MNRAAYYNEIDPYAAQWLRNLIAAGRIAAGDVDERSVVDVRPDELRGFTQVQALLVSERLAFQCRTQCNEVAMKSSLSPPIKGKF